MTTRKLFLVDGHTLCYRAYYAIRGLTNSKGQPTNAVLGFINILRKILREYKPDYMVICFDSGKKTHRQKKFAEYKIQRPSMPNDLIEQIPIIKEVIKAFNLEIFECEGYEADDIIATVSNKTAKEDVDVVIVSEDKDMYQLINDKVKILNSRKDSILGVKESKQLLGFHPKQIVDFIALAGDKSDNIPGISGIGDVTAKKLLNKYGSLDDLINNLDEIDSDNVKEKIKNQKDNAILSRELAVLEKDVPINFNLNKSLIKDPDKNRLFEIFKELEFKKLAQEYMVPEDNTKNIKTKTINNDDISLIIDKVKKNKKFVFLIDIKSKESNKEQLLFSDGIAVCFDSTEAYYIPIKMITSLKSIFEDRNTLIITHNIKEVLKLFSDDKISIKGNVFDVMLAGYLLGSSKASFSLNDLSWNYLKSSFSDEASIAEKLLIIYNLHSILIKELKKKSLLELLNDIEVPLSNVLFKMENHGVTLDLKLLKKLSKDCEDKIQELTAKLFKMSGEEFNLNSPKQLSNILFEQLKLPVIKKTKTGFSTDESVLSKLALKHEFPALILEYRQIAKLKSTYIDALPKLINEKTGRIHATFNQTGTETGRLSSNNPNLQNIPIRTDLGRQIRKAFIPSDKDLIMLSADYSQIELRILAHLSKDENLIEAFKRGEDIHTYTASLIFDVEEKKVDARMRDSAKRVNFGIIYGMSAFGLSKDLGIPQGEAQEFIDKYFLRYPKVKDFMDNTIKECTKKGYVSTILNRIRYIPEIRSKNNSIVQFAQRQAINTPVQGSAADLIKLAMLNIQNEIEKRSLKSKMIITVHDELVFEVLNNELKEMVSLVRKFMENPLKLIVPIKATIKQGKNWLEMKEII